MHIKYCKTNHSNLEYKVLITFVKILLTYMHATTQRRRQAMVGASREVQALVKCSVSVNCSNIRKMTECLSIRQQKTDYISLAYLTIGIIMINLYNYVVIYE